MISTSTFIRSLAAEGINFFTGVPDSLLKNICAYLTDHSSPEKNIIAANEGAAIAVAAGYHLATGKIPVVYMQNSGLGNSVNPLLSLIDEEVYNIPLLMFIGWRGEPGVSDEPQHTKQGKTTIPLLEAMGIKYAIMSKTEFSFLEQFKEALSYIHGTQKVYAFIVQKDTFDTYRSKKEESSLIKLAREDAIRSIVSEIEKESVIISTTGMISRELFEIREERSENHSRDFLTVGSMGHASQIALGIALNKPHLPIYCLDGDGALLMHMGSMGIIGSISPKNYIHIVLNNGAHDSVGGQPTVGLKSDFRTIAKAFGYKTVISVSTNESLLKSIAHISEMEKPVFLEVRVSKGARKDLGRPFTTPIQNKESLMFFLKSL